LRFLARRSAEDIEIPDRNFPKRQRGASGEAMSAGAKVREGRAASVLPAPLEWPRYLPSSASAPVTG